MLAKLHLVAWTLLLLPISQVFADEPLPQEVPPPTAAELKEALEKFCSLFSWLRLPPAKPVQQPDWFPLKPEEAKRVDEVLAAWEKSRAKGSSFRCQFRKWEYDPVFGSKDGKTPARFSEGEYRTDSADIWMYRVERALKSVITHGKTEWIDSDSNREYWARNKTTFYELDYRGKRLIERRFPEDAVDTPVFGLFGLEFLVGNVATCFELLRLEPAGLQERFWVRPVTARDESKDSWLELVPKKPRDARLFSSIIVVISESDSELRAMDIRASNYSAATNPAHTEIEFVHHKNPATRVPGMIICGFGQYGSCVPSVPAGWKMVVEDYRVKK